jgi:hypothetical protein
MLIALLLKAAMKIEMLLNDPKHYIEKALLALGRSKAFTYEKFSERLCKLLDIYLQGKKREA